MKNALKKLIYPALILTLLIPASCALAGTLNTETIKMPSSQWEARFTSIITSLELVKDVKPVFTVTEYEDRSPEFRFAHTFDINEYIQVVYYDDGKDNFHSAILTISLDGVKEPFNPVWFSIMATTGAGDPKATSQLIIDLVLAICPPFNDVLAGKERLNGTQSGLLHGVGYAMELNDTERFVRFYTNVELTPNN